MFVQMPAVNRDILIPVADVLKTLAAVSTASRLVHLTVIAQVVSPVLQPNTNSILVNPVILNPVIAVSRTHLVAVEDIETMAVAVSKNVTLLAMRD